LKSFRYAQGGDLPPREPQCEKRATLKRARARRARVRSVLCRGRARSECGGARMVRARCLTSRIGWSLKHPCCRPRRPARRPRGHRTRRIITRCRTVGVDTPPVCSNLPPETGDALPENVDARTATAWTLRERGDCHSVVIHRPTGNRHRRRDRETRTRKLVMRDVKMDIRCRLVDTYRRLVDTCCRNRHPHSWYLFLFPS
jgi:hypothetical protein